MGFMMLVCLGIVVFGFGVLGVHGTGESAYGERQSDAAGTEISTGLLSDLSAQITSVDLRGAVRLLLLPTPLVTTTAATTVMSASIETACEGEKRTRNHLEFREIIVTPAPTLLVQDHSQHPTVTTQWVPTILPDGATTYIEIVFTQTFASVLDPLPSPGEGEIGMGADFGGLDGEVEIKAMGGANRIKYVAGRAMVVGFVAVLIGIGWW